MPVEFIGMIATKDQSETRLSRGPIIDKEFTRRFVRAHEDAGFDRVLIGYASSHPDGTQVAAYAASAQRAARLPGRAPARLRRPDARRPPVHHPRPVQRRPDRGAHHHRRARRRAAPRRRLPVQGRALRPHRRVPGHRPAGLDVRPAVQLPRPVLPGRGPPVRRPVGPGTRDQAVLRRLVRGGLPGRRQARRHLRAVGRAAGRDQAADRLGQRRPPRTRAAPTPPASASASGRSSARPRNWPGSARTASSRPPRRTSPPSAPSGAPSRSASAATTRRTSARSGCSRPPPRASCTTGRCGRPLAAATGAGGNSTALVGTPETVAQAILDYVDIGVTTILIRGYDPYDDAIDYGRQLLPLVREEVARRDAEQAAAARRERERGGAA